MMMHVRVLYTVTDLRKGQISHGLGHRGYGSPAQLFPITNQLKICGTAQGHNFTIYFDMIGNSNVYSRFLGVK